MFIGTQFDILSGADLSIFLVSAACRLPFLAPSWFLGDSSFTFCLSMYSLFLPLICGNEMK